MKLPAFLQPRVLAHVLRALIAPPFAKRFPHAPLALPEGFRGRPRFNEVGCIGCGACAEVCPPKCIDVIDVIDGASPVRRLIQHLDACIWCGQCERHCPTREGITLTDDFDCVGFAPEDFEERVEKALLLCELCGAPIAPVDQIRWLVRRLGALAYANPTLMMFQARELGVADGNVRSQGPEATRGGMIGWVRKKDLPRELAGEAFRLKKKALSGVIESRHGWHILRVDAVERARNLDIEGVIVDVVATSVDRRFKGLTWADRRCSIKAIVGLMSVLGVGEPADHENCRSEELVHAQNSRVADGN